MPTTSMPTPALLAAPPRWATVAAHVAALTPLPSALWRLALTFGLTAGYTAEGYRERDLTGWGVPYVLMLGVVAEVAALMPLGLVQRWDEVVPGWHPFVGVLYLPLVVWGPLLAAVTWSYHRRRRAALHRLDLAGTSA